MTRLVGMILILGALVAGLVGLSAAFYWVAGQLAVFFYNQGLPAAWGAAVANLERLIGIGVPVVTGTTGWFDRLPQIEA